MNLIVKRMAAWMIDWMIIMLYAAVLFAVVRMLASAEIISIGVMHPFKGQLIGILTLTLPVVLYGIFMEHYKRMTLGKRIMKLTVSKCGIKGIVIRNVLKFLPWEFAHAGILWANYMGMGDMGTPLWIWALLIVPQVVVVVYFVWIVSTGGRKSLYDSIAETEIAQTTL